MAPWITTVVAMFFPSVFPHFDNIWSKSSLSGPFSCVALRRRISSTSKIYRTCGSLKATATTDVVVKKNKLRCYPQQLESFCVLAIKSAYAIKIKRLCCHQKYRNTLELHKASAQEPSGTSQGICTGTLWNLTKHLLRQNLPEPHKVSAPEPSGTSPSIFSAKTFRNLTRSLTGTFRNLTRYLHRNPPEPHRTFRSLSRYLHQIPPEPCPEPGVEAAPDRTGAHLG